MLTLIQATLLVFVALGGLIVVKIRDPLRQTVALSFYGLLLALVFFSFQAPDVAFSALVVGSVALPLMILLALSKVQEAQRQAQHEAQQEAQS